MKLLLVCAMEQERDLALAALRDKANGYPVASIVTGIGRMNAAIGLLNYIQGCGDDFKVLNFGFAGYNGDNLNIGDSVLVCASSLLTDPDIQLRDMEVKWSLDLPSEIYDLPWLECVTSDSFVQANHPFLKEKGILFDMELMGLVRIARNAGMQVYSCKVISDVISENNYKDFEKMLASGKVDLSKFVELYKYLSDAK